MATYVYRCQECGTQADHDYPIGTARRTRTCTCGAVMRQVLGHIRVQPSALESRSTVLRSQLAMDQHLGPDRDAYKRMRRRGLQPPSVGGSARLEDQVGDQLDIDHRPLLTSGVSKERLVGALEEAAVMRVEAGTV